MDVNALILQAKACAASDIHLAAGSPVMFRIHGVLEAVDAEAGRLTSDDTRELFFQLTSEKQRADFEHDMEMDFAYSLPEQVRLRCNAAMQRGSICVVMRLISNTIPDIDELKIPEICKELVARPRGMFIVSGPTGSGKSTTLAAMIDYLNHTEKRRVVTIEDPIEYVYTSQKCNITQRELGEDTHSFAEALRHVLRQDPDVILVGEMRDLETAAAAINIAETGHLLLTTGHAPSSYQAVERVIDMFPLHERGLAQTRMASLLIGILCQALVPRLDGKGRVPAVEVLLANSAVKNLIREGKIHQLPNSMRMHVKSGMQLLDHALVRLYRDHQISIENVYGFCSDREEAEKLMAGM